MLFANERLKTIFDFGEYISKEDATIKNLADTIVRQITLLGDLLDQGESIDLYHPIEGTVLKEIPTDVYLRDAAAVSQILYRSPQDKLSIAGHVRAWGSEMPAQEDDLRNTTAVSQILYRSPQDKPSIAGYVRAWGIEAPAQEEEDYPSYLQLLYFLYMTRYLIFPEVNLFHLLEQKNRSTDFSPMKHAGNGKYLTFLLENLLENREIGRWITGIDGDIEEKIHGIASLLDRLLDYHNPETGRYVDLLIEDAKKIQEKYIQQDPEEKNVIHWAVDYIYRYQNTAYAEEMIHTLLQGEPPFRWKELEIYPPKEWKEQYLPAEADICMKFLGTAEAGHFYLQANRNRPKYLDLFLNNILDYDREVCAFYGRGLWIEEDEDYGPVISLFKLAILAKTFMDLGTDTFDILIRKNRKKWEHRQSYRKILPGPAPIDIAMRYFYIAWESELMNAVVGPGYYALLYHPLYIRKYGLLQIFMKMAFEIQTPENRSRFLADMQEMVITHFDEYQE